MPASARLSSGASDACFSSGALSSGILGGGGISATSALIAFSPVGVSSGVSDSSFSVSSSASCFDFAAGYGVVTA